jgi:hypothetical protein
MSLVKQERSYGVVMAVTVCMASAAAAAWYHQKHLKTVDSVDEVVDASSAEDKIEI